ncbi:MAG: DMT family transporter, partial [Clostridia bacterium]|nr:DMT family transporter [Clostridia bacterium]
MSKTKTVIFAFITMLLWGSLFPVVKLGYGEFGLNTSFIPDLIFFAGIRFVISGALLSGYSGIKKTYKVDNKKKYLAVILIGIFSITFHYACTYIGLSKTDSSKTALLKQLGVVFFICFSFLFIKEDKFSVFKMLSAVFGVLGIAVLNFDSLKFSFGIGELLIILASVCTVVSNILCKKFTVGVDPLFVTGGSELFGGVILLIFGV